jgi:hypothetical protein
MDKAKKVRQILEKHRVAQKLRKAHFAEELGVSRQLLHNWLVGADISIQWLSERAVDWVGEWRGRMMVELLMERGEYLVPCVCQTRIGDCGMCPKHGQNPTSPHPASPN